MTSGQRKLQRGALLSQAWSVAFWPMALLEPDWPDADYEQTAPNESETAELIPEFEFDQTVSW